MRSVVTFGILFVLLFARIAEADSGGEISSQEETNNPALEPLSIIVDNPLAIQTGWWSVGTVFGDFGDYHHDNDTSKGLATITYHPVLASQASYAVYAYFLPGSNRSSKTPYTIHAIDGDFVVTIDQRYSIRQWTYLGEFNLGPGSSVTISNEGTDGYVVADAMRFESPSTFVPVEPSLEQLYGNYETAGVVVNLGDFPAEIEGGRVFLRKAGEPAFREVHPFIKYDANHLATSIFNLEPDTQYEVRADLDNGMSVSGSLRTKAEWALSAPSRQIEVTTDSELLAALSAALPGDHIVLAPGTYTSYKPAGKSWHARDISGAPGRIVVRSKDPTRRATLLGGFHTNGCSHWTLHQLNFFNGRGVDFRASNHMEVVECEIRNPRDGVDYGAAVEIHHASEVPGTDKTGSNLIMNCHLVDRDPVTTNTTYYGIKQDTGVGGYTTIRGNTIHGFDDGISPGGDEGEPPILDETAANVATAWPNREIDIYDNVIYDAGDDCIETDGHMTNGRIFRNYLGKCTNALTVAPVYPGPYFIVGNHAHGFMEGWLKLNTGVSGVTRRIYCYHNSIYQVPESRKYAIYRGTPSRNQDIVYRNNAVYALTRVIDTDYGVHLRHDYDYDLMWSTRPIDDRYYIFKWGQTSGETKSFKNFVSFVDWTGQERHGVYGDPRFIPRVFPGTPPEANVRILAINAASPGIDRGVVIPGVNDNYLGNGPDMGAYEFGHGELNSAHPFWRLYQ